jgi:Immunoglobulin domain
VKAAAAILRGTALLGAVAVLTALSAEDSRKKQEIVFPEIASHGLADAPFEITAHASSGLPVTIELVDGPAVLDGKKLRLTHVPGLVIVRATQKGNDAFLPAIPAERAFGVGTNASAPIIRTGLGNGFVALGAELTLVADVSGDPAPALQWRKNGEAITGATGSRFTISAAGPADSGDYDVVATNAQGSVIGLRTHVTVGKRLQTITFQLPTVLMAGQTVTLSAVASSGLPVTFDVVSGQAQVLGSVLTVATSGLITVQASQAGNEAYEAAAPVSQSVMANGGVGGQRVP